MSDAESTRALRTVTRDIRELPGRGHVVRLKVNTWDGAYLDPDDAVQLAHELQTLAMDAVHADRAARRG